LYPKEKRPMLFREKLRGPREKKREKGYYHSVVQGGLNKSGVADSSSGKRAPRSSRWPS